MILGDCKKNYHQTANTHAEDYFNHERNSHMTFKWLLERFIAYDIVKEKKRTRRKTTTNDENAINILAIVQLNPINTIRLIGN